MLNSNNGFTKYLFKQSAYKELNFIAINNR
jgi:hypothetical protein